MKGLLVQTPTTSCFFVILTDTSFYSCFICIIESDFYDLFLCHKCFSEPCKLFYCQVVCFDIYKEKQSLMHKFVLVQFVVLQNSYC